jgi:hypothetical protein
MQSRLPFVLLSTALHMMLFTTPLKGIIWYLNDPFCKLDHVRVQRWANVTVQHQSTTLDLNNLLKCDKLTCRSQRWQQQASILAALGKPPGVPLRLFIGSLFIFWILTNQRAVWTCAALYSKMAAVSNFFPFVLRILSDICVFRDILVRINLTSSKLNKWNF